MLRTVVFALTLNPSPKWEEGLLSGSASGNIARRGWGMRVFLFIQNYSFQRGRGLADLGKSASIVVDVPNSVRYRLGET
ncbi:hypothetical protein [Nostoc sp.]|uniref:hypothetical protein n=1 Tax=Nostoc sp. TaxID=1180 RepID=UPI002FF6AF7A